MRILICSDGTDPADKPARLGSVIASACGAATTLLGIAEQPQNEPALRDALDSEARLLVQAGVQPLLVVRAGDPVEQILQETAANSYDLVIIGTRVKQTSGRYWRSHRTYELIKAIPPPVLVASGETPSLSKLLVCSGGKHYIETAVQLTGEIAACAGASVTLLHVMAEPPAVFTDLVRMEEDVDALLAGGSELGRNLLAQKQTLEKLGIDTEVRVRHGIVLDQVFAERRQGGHDVIVTGSSQSRGALQHYIMGDLTRSILNRAPCPVLVARPQTPPVHRTIWASLKQIFASGPS